jgi:chemotaxis protein methyltransferase CheR
MEFSDKVEALNKLSGLLYSKYGLEYKTRKVKDLSTAVNNMAEIQGLSVTEVFKKLLSDNQSEKFIWLLLDSLKISETYFFREEPTLYKICNEVLKKSYLDETTIWCAGCSSGEEPYSLLMMLNELDYTLSKTSLKLDASDINRNLLEHAKNGLYSNWSFRNTPPEIKDKYFEKSDNLYKIDSRFINHVNFSETSLTDNLSIILSGKSNYYDIILCRNVLIYHSDIMREKILENFYFLLKPGGLLFTGLTEIPFVKNKKFEKVMEKEIIYYIKGIPVRQPIVKPIDAPVVKTDVPQFQPNEDNEISCIELLEKAKRIYNSGEYKQCIETVNNILNQNKSKTIALDVMREATLLLINSHINIGENNSAVNECKKYIKSNINDHIFYLMLANLYVDSDDNDSAIDNLIKAIYLKPDYIAAHLLLGKIYFKDKKVESAEKHYRICLKLLSQISNDTIIDDTDGFSAGSLVQVINNILKNL